MAPRTSPPSTTDVHAGHLLNQRRHVETAIGLRVPNCQPVYTPHTESTGELWLVDQWSGSWANLAARPGPPPYEVRRAGQRMLFDEVAASYRWWLDAWEPTVHDWLLTITPTLHTVVLDRPGFDGAMPGPATVNLSGGLGCRGGSAAQR